MSSDSIAEESVDMKFETLCNFLETDLELLHALSIEEIQILILQALV